MEKEEVAKIWSVKNSQDEIRCHRSLAEMANRLEIEAKTKMVAIISKQLFSQLYPSSKSF